MTKQEEIRKGMADRIHSFTGCSNDEAEYCATQLLKYLDFMGVEIKATQEYPNLPHFIYEPLIEEIKK